MAFLTALISIVLAAVVGIVAGAIIIWLIVIKNKKAVIKLLGGISDESVSESLKTELLTYIDERINKIDVIAYDDNGIRSNITELQDTIAELQSQVGGVISYIKQISSINANVVDDSSEVEEEAVNG